jgi:enoyl-CoA hydratase
MSVLFDQINGWGVITLNKPATLNALDLQMVMAIRSFLRQVALDTAVKCIFIHSAVPNIFCSGGDIKAVYQSYLNNDTVALSTYVEEEYGLNADIKAFPKPVVALMNGLTLGGGVGLSRYASYRIATTEALVGMPEVKIAFFPDVGAGYFLNLLNPQLARFLGLTGCLLRGQDLITTGYATHLILPKNIATTTQDILKTDPSDLDNLLSSDLSTPSTLTDLSDVIDCFSLPTLEGCLDQLRECSHPLAGSFYEDIITFSPYALKIIWDYLDRTKGLTYEDVLAMDLELAKQMFHYSDVFEGIRTRLIDKQDKPQWKYASLDDVVL